MTLSNDSNEAFFFEASRKRRLYGFLHKKVPEDKDVGIVYCHPFAEERNMSHRIAVETANAIANTGIPVLRFDFSGCGDSEDELENISIEDMVLDIGYAVEILKKKMKVSRCILWGLRVGAGLGLLYSDRFSNVDGLMLWEPVLDFNLFIKRFFRTRRSSLLTRAQHDVADKTEKNGDSKTIYINGYPISSALYKEFQEIGKKPFNIIPDIPIAIFSLSLLENPWLTVANYQNACKINRYTTNYHLKVEPFWDRYWRWACPELAEASRDWVLLKFQASIDGRNNIN